MAVTRIGMVQRHPVVAYALLALTFSWGIAIPLAASAQGWLNPPLPMALHYVTAYGPLLAAVVVSWMLEGRVGLSELRGRVARWRVGWGWWVFSAFSPMIAFIVIAAGRAWMGGEWPRLEAFGQLHFLPPLGLLAWPLWILTFGLGEETGWRGFALPYLQRRYSTLSATLILAVIWLVWHTPYFFYLPTYVKLGWTGVVGLALGLTAGAILLTWLFNETGGSVLMTALWHGGFNFITASEAGAGVVAAVVSALVMVWAVVLVARYRPMSLATRAKTV